MMTSASPSVQWPSPSHEDRIRRNVACVNCRNSKVRCRQSHVPGQPCQRCAKLEISCVVDKAHKRTTKRSKLEKLEKELDAIKQAVRPGSSTSNDEPRPPRSPRASYSSYPEQFQPSISQRTAFHLTPTSLPDQPTITAARSSTFGFGHPARRPPKDGPSQARTIGAKLVSGLDIDEYFDKYLECFHPFVPVLRKKDPDECYVASPTLFWVIVFVTCRRYSRDPDLINVITECLSKDIWNLLSSPIMNLDAVHALLLMCAWPLPTIRFATDPSTTFAGIAMNVCMLLGLHTGRGYHSEFCVGSRQNISSTDEEASCTWIQACIFAQGSASNIGHPPPSIQLNDAPCKRALSSPEWSDLLIMFDVQKFLNRLHLAMAAHVTSNGYVIESLVSSWEDEFETLKPVIARHDTDLSRFLLLSAQLEIQGYYFTHPPDNPGPNLTLNTTRSLGNAKALINTALALESSPSKFLTHAPQWAFRSVMDASCLLVSALHSSSPPPLGPSEDPASVAHRCYAASMACSVRDGDLPYRGASLIQGFWTCRDQAPLSDSPVRSWPNRLGAGVTFYCLHRFKCALHGAKNSENAHRVLKAIQPPRTEESETADGQEAQPQTADAPIDPFSEVDWSMFMDDFAWGGDDAIFLGLP